MYSEGARHAKFHSTECSRECKKVDCRRNAGTARVQRREFKAPIHTILWPMAFFFPIHCTACFIPTLVRLYQRKLFTFLLIIIQNFVRKNSFPPGKSNENEIVVELEVPSAHSRLCSQTADTPKCTMQQIWDEYQSGSDPAKSVWSACANESSLLRKALRQTGSESILAGLAKLPSIGSSFRSEKYPPGCQIAFFSILRQRSYIFQSSHLILSDYLTFIHGDGLEGKKIWRKVPMFPLGKCQRFPRDCANNPPFCRKRFPFQFFLRESEREGRKRIASE